MNNIKNNDLPAAEDKKVNDKANELISVVPVTRKIERLYDGKEIDEIDSPILRKKLKSGSKSK